MGIKSAAAPVAVLVAGLFAANVASAGRYAGLESCELAAAGGRLTVQARCGSLEVPENPAEPEGRRLELAFAVIPARAARSEPDPVVFLAGGPGQSAREAAALVRAALNKINRTRDLVFLDQRGTGGSHPLKCDFGEIEAYLEPDWDEYVDIIRGCLEGYEVDVRFFTTAQGAGDLEALRGHLGFEEWNLIGGSYGTRMAQVYLRRYPERVRSVILDGVVPTRLALGSEHGRMLDRALARLIAACGADQACAGQFPDLESAFDALRVRYRDRPAPLVLDHPRTGEPEEFEFNHDFLAGALRFLAYSPETQALIPLLVHDAHATDNPRRLAAQGLILMERMDEAIAVGLNFAVGCSEDWPRWSGRKAEAGTLLGDTMAELYRRICAFWPAGEVDPDFHQPFDAGVPVLILSGEFDPVTPPAYGDEVARQFSRSLHLVAPGRGHIVITNRCIAGIAARFVESASLEDLDTGCMDAIGPEPFFIDLLGPTP